MISLITQKVKVTVPLPPRVSINTSFASGNLRTGYWAGFGPPLEPIPTSIPGDQYIDLLTWDLYILSGA